MPEKNRKKRELPISIRVSRDDREEINRLAEKAEISRNALIISRVLGRAPVRQSRRSYINHKVDAKLTVHFGQLRDQLERIEALGGEHGNTPLMEKAVVTLAEIRELLMQAAGRRS